MSKMDTLRPNSGPTILQRWGHFRMRTVGDTGILGFGLRWGVLLLFAVYFFVPLLWLVLATYKGVVVTAFIGAFAVTVLIFAMAFFVREY